MTRRAIFFLIGVVVGALVATALFRPTSAWAEGCPPDKPFKRFVSGFPEGVTKNNLNLVYCPPRLVCPLASDRCSYVAGCSVPAPPAEREICLSQDELDRAK